MGPIRQVKCEVNPCIHRPVISDISDTRAMKRVQTQFLRATETQRNSSGYNWQTSGNRTSVNTVSLLAWLTLRF